MVDTQSPHQRLHKSGMVALPGLLETIESVLDHCSFIEVEPQTFWRQDDEGQFSVETSTLKRIKRWGKPISLHGVGTPVGGSIFPIDAQLDSLLESIDILKPLWITEHLAFNRCPGRAQFTGFFLPPIQTAEAVEIAANNLRVFQSKLGIPVGFETGVNYFPKNEDQLSDGAFFKAIAELADCGIVLDIHNLWCNERNGRDSVNQVLDEIPFDRVWEVHVAGGDSFYGYYLDSHSALPDPYLPEVLSALVLPRAHNLRAIVFEITSTNYLANRITADQLAACLKQLQMCKATKTPDAAPATGSSLAKIAKTTTQSVIDWEQSLVDQLFADRKTIEEKEVPGIELYRRLIDSNRLGSLANLCTLTVRLSVKVFGADKTKTFFQVYLDQSYPALTSEQEVLQFVQYIEKSKTTPLWFKNALDIDMGRVKASNTLERVTVTLNINPDLLFDAVKNGLSRALDPDGKIYHLELQP